MATWLEISLVGQIIARARQL